MRRLASLLVLSAVLLAPAVAEARIAQPYAYRYEQVWSAAVRMVRVDLRMPVTDRDQELGFILFDYVDGRRSLPGSIELLRTPVDGQEQIRVTMQVPAMPSYVERMLLDRLQRKLVEDFGEPLRAPRRPATPPPAEDDDDEDDDDTPVEDAAPAPREPSRREQRRERAPAR
jgi:hypothetical protein